MNWLHPPGPVAQGLRIGLLGGSFNPAHDGHLYVGDVALRRLGLDYVWWLVAPQNPLKPVADMAPLEKRLAAARALAGRDPRLIVTDLERMLGTRYTIDTLKALARRFRGVRFVWLMGSDNLDQFHRWRRWEEIVRLVPVAPHGCICLRKCNAGGPGEPMGDLRGSHHGNRWKGDGRDGLANGVCEEVRFGCQKRTESGEIDRT